MINPGEIVLAVGLLLNAAAVWYAAVLVRRNNIRAEATNMVIEKIATNTDGMMEQLIAVARKEGITEGAQIERDAQKKR